MKCIRAWAKANSTWRNCVAKTPFRNGRKGDTLLTHTITLVFSLLMILTIVITFNSMENDYRDFIGKNEVQQVCGIVKSGIESIYLKENYDSPENATKGRIVIELPARIADMDYRVRFINRSVSIETLGRLRVNDTCKIGFAANYTGSTIGGRTEINFTAYSDGSSVIAMRRL